MQRYTVDKKEGNREFDVTMGSNDRTKMCKFVYSTGKKFNKDGLYRLYRFIQRCLF